MNEHFLDNSILERKLENIIYDTYVNNPNLLKKRGLFLLEDAKIYQQLDLKKYGRLDLLLIKKDEYTKIIYSQIVELKKNSINVDTIKQGFRYTPPIAGYLHENYEEYKLFIQYIFIGYTIDDELSYMYDNKFFNGKSNEIEFYMYDIDLINGIKFDRVRAYGKNGEKTFNEFNYLNLDLDNLDVENIPEIVD